MIPKINLDDRTFDDIFNEALRLIPRYCPEWTNHNTSDPGITLLELFSWMTEMTIYRLNKVPEKIYLSLLELMGMSLSTPQSARSIIQFFPVEGINRDISINSGTQIAAAVTDSADIIFETEKTIKIKNIKLQSCINRVKENISENIINDKLENFFLFESKNSVEHDLYLCSESFKYLELEHYAAIEFVAGSDIVKESDQLTKHVFWEFWDGEKWMELKYTSSINNLREKDNVIYIHGNIPIEKTIVNGHEGYWIRAVLSDVPEKPSTLSIKAISIKTIFGAKGFAPDMCICNNQNQYAVVDMNTSFRMFSENPEYNECFYISADEILSNSKAKIEFLYTFSESNGVGEENKNALFIYEYWNGSDWIKISEKDNFVDGTFNLKQSGTVSFVIPKDISMISVNNEEHYWIRVRLITKDLATGGVYVKDDKDNWMWKFTSRVQTPVFDKIRIKYEAHSAPPLHCFAYTNFTWKDLNSLTKKDSKKETKNSEINVFDLEAGSLPALYLGFDEKFSEGESSLYFRMDEIIGHDKKNDFTIINKKELFYNKKQRQLNLYWEYYNGSEWKPLIVSDNTDSFHQSGFIDFVAPVDSSSAALFGKNLYWFRVSLISGSFETAPHINDILLNCVYARNEKTYENEILGSGTGAPGQSVFVAHKNILKDSVLYVDEGSIPSENELRRIREDSGSEPYITEGSKVWVRYKEVENFYSSDAFSRHYVVDYSTGKIQFGDGSKGVNPPKGKFNIKMKSYRTGGGSIGNVARNTIRGLLQGIPFVSGCTNPFPAEGGADMETVDSLKARAAGSFKSLQRAVTSEDFEWIAREASPSVGRANCLNKRNSKNEICTVIVPVRPAGVGYETKLIPSRELIRRVKEYLEERKIVGTPLCVQGPVYKEFNISLALTFKSDVIEEGGVKNKIEKALRSYYDSLEGDEGKGWPFEKEITGGSVLKQLEKINEILSVNTVELFDLDANVQVEKILLKDAELPFLNKVVIEKR